MENLLIDSLLNAIIWFGFDLDYLNMLLHDYYLWFNSSTCYTVTW